jgi:hypothetical protein
MLVVMLERVGDVVIYAADASKGRCGRGDSRPGGDGHGVTTTDRVRT